MLKNASAAIFAVDVAVKEEERFSHLPTIKTKVSAPVSYTHLDVYKRQQLGLGVDLTSQSVIDKKRMVFGDTDE